MATWKPQPSAYFMLVLGHLPANDRYAQYFYCLASGLLLHILNLFMNLLCIHYSVQIQNMLMDGK